MGSFLSKKRHLKRVSCTKTNTQSKHNDYAVNAKILKRCSTFGAESQPAFESPTKVPAVVAKVLSESPLQSPTQNKPHKYDPVYALWKNAFEDHKLRSPRKVSPIKDESAHQPNITGVVAGQLTPKGFPSYTDVRKSVNNKKLSNDENDNKNPSTFVGRRLSFQMSLNSPLSPKTIKDAPARPQINEHKIQEARPQINEQNTKETSEEHIYQNALPNLQQIVDEINETAQASMHETLFHTSSTSLEYTPKFLAMMANEKAAVVQKFFRNHKHSPVSKSAAYKRSFTMSPTRSKPAVLRQPKRSTSRCLPYQAKNVNATPNFVKNDLSPSYNIYKDYYFL